MANEPELGVATYTAEQVAGAVIIHAKGDAPASGYRVWLEKSMIALYPPEFALYWEPPGGLAADVMMPFIVHVSFPAEDPVDSVIVRDADGAHEVPVEQVPD